MALRFYGSLAQIPLYSSRALQLYDHTYLDNELYASMILIVLTLIAFEINYCRRKEIQRRNK